MTHQLDFASVIAYDAGALGIPVAVVLRAGEAVASCEAKLDTGSSHCVFKRMHGEFLGFEIESGWPRTFSTATGAFLAYGHSVTLSVKSFDFDAMVYFAKDDDYNRNVLGRHGFLQLVRLGLIDYDGQPFLSHRDDE
jgi:hypothetical protein